MKMESLKQAWLVLLLAACFGAALAAVQVAWGPRIEQNKEDDARGKIPEIVPGADPNKTPAGRNVELQIGGASRLYRVYCAMDAADKQIGWVIKAKGSGYADFIEILVGLDMSGKKITGMAVLSQNETPGLGNKIKDASFRDQFGKPAPSQKGPGRTTTPPLEVVQKGQTAANPIVSISGATISSQSVTNIVNKTVADFPKIVAEFENSKKKDQ